MTDLLRLVGQVGLPGGLEPRHDQLKELVKAKTIAYYEVIGREVCCYFRQLQPSEEVRSFKPTTNAG